ncbi:MAG: hypothetical protein L0H36_02630 [bacterium]|nr:hypothetical protein [bacterium]MDN5835508.1 hypothetical protein [bacterium]
MRALNVLQGGVPVSVWLAAHTDKRPKQTSVLMSKNNGVTIPVEQDVLLRVVEAKNNTFLVRAGQAVHFFQNPDRASILPRTIVFTVFEGQVAIATYRKDVGITEKHKDRR